ncbi:hypothetical protein RRG08_039079 [Elysia crispata]|uniref:Uncharacterized protein n=1 Tax=Elysia crispata TaxID=231223 RepID=A0AAE0YJV9_9GAST|nr:hypothetical protein RRG08_039079 [Elysia crispata]
MSGSVACHWCGHVVRVNSVKEARDHNDLEATCSQPALSERRRVKCYWSSAAPGYSMFTALNIIITIGTSSKAVLLKRMLQLDIEAVDLATRNSKRSNTGKHDSGPHLVAEFFWVICQKLKREGMSVVE